MRVPFLGGGGGGGGGVKLFNYWLGLGPTTVDWEPLALPIKFNVNNTCNFVQKIPIFFKQRFFTCCKRWQFRFFYIFDKKTIFLVLADPSFLSSKFQTHC